jgi:hypothetical protein
MEFQDWVCVRLAQDGIVLQNLSSKKYQLAVGENIQGFEIKLDTRCTDTGRLSIEVAEKSRRDNERWVDSGIWRNDNTWLYIQGNRDLLFVFPKKALQWWYRKRKPELLDFNGTIRRFFLPMKQARQLACKVYEKGAA